MSARTWRNLPSMAPKASDAGYGEDGKSRSITFQSTEKALTEVPYSGIYSMVLNGDSLEVQTTAGVFRIEGEELSMIVAAYKRGALAWVKPGTTSGTKVKGVEPPMPG